MSKIVIVDFGRVEDVSFEELREALAARFHREIERGRPKEIPESGFDGSRNQYLAGAFLGELRAEAKSKDVKYLGVTEVDLFSRGLNLVFGQADVGGSAAIISLARLHPEGLDGGAGEPELRRDRVLTEAVHELGHTFGLQHCRDKYCVMHFSRALPDTDLKSADFCPRHEAELP